MVEWLLRGSCAVMFVGFGWMGWIGQMPFRALLWDEALISDWVVRLTGMDWGTWVSSMEVNETIDRAVRVQAWLFFLYAIVSLLPVRSRLVGAVYLFSFVNLVGLAWLKYHDAGMGVGQLIEHASQFCLPLILALYIWGRRWTTLTKVSLGATFIGHGVFAIGVLSETVWLNHPRPGQFVEMTMLSLGLESEATAGAILLVAGIIDFLVAGMIFLPAKVRSPALCYMVLWGAITAFARPWSYYEPSAATESLVRWIPEFLFRVPHFVLPAVLLLALRADRAAPGRLEVSP